MRAAGLFAFCLFSSNLSTATSLTCEKCVALGEECGIFDMTVVKCKEEEEFCSAFVAKTTITNYAASAIIKGCSTRKECLAGLFTTTTVGGRFQIARAKCCQTDLCNAEPLPLPDYDKLLPNGLRCPGCYALDENNCKANQSVICVGEEDQCLNVTRTIDAFGFVIERSSLQGCTTQNSCSFPQGWFEKVSGVIQFNVISLECRNETSSELDLQ